MTEYTFPFDTCEKPNTSGIAQPYSVLVNLINCSIIFYYLIKTENNNSFLLLGSLLIFELFHTISHSIHIKGKFLYTITHAAAFLYNILLFNFLYNYTSKFPHKYYIVFLACIILFDIYALYNSSVIYFILTQFLLFASILYYYYPFLPTKIKNKIHWIGLSAVLIYLGFINEKINCKKMLKVYPNFPFHIIIELFSIIPVYLLSSGFYKA